MNMADTNTQGTQGQDQAGAGGDTPRKLYATRAEAESNKPTDATKNSKVYEVAKGSTVLGYLWAQGYADCAQWAARSDGYKFSLGKTAPVTVEAAAAKLATLDDAALAALGLTRTPLVATTPPAAAPVTSPAKKGGRK
jgi:hypothetical protein